MGTDLVKALEDFMPGQRAFGNQFALHIGQDLSIGYLDHDADVVRLYVEESFTFKVLEPDAAVAIRAEA